VCRKIHLSREGGRFEHGVEVLFFYARMNGHWSHYTMKGTGSVEGSKFLDQSGSIPDAGTLSVGSLFSGIGGFELGFEATGRFKTLWQVERDSYATQVLAKHWPDVVRHDDVCTWPNKKTQPVDVIIGGFPCQDISYAGKGAGLDGERSGLFYELMRIVRVVGPKYVVFENVAALFTRGMDQVLGTLASRGYDAEWEVVSAASVGAPHRRDRVFIIGYLADSDDKQCKGCEQETLRRKSRVSRESGRSSSDQRGMWATEPSVDRVVNGFPKRMDRLRCLGNAVVPQVAQVVAERLLEIHDQNN